MAEVRVHGLSLSGSDEAQDEYLHELRRGHVEPFTAELFARSVRRGATVVDGGAFLGLYALLAARRVGPEGIVFAFEPDPEAFEVLRRNIRDNDFEDRVIPLPLSLGGVTLDEALGARPIDLLKLEVDGGEVEALRGMRLTLAASEDPCVIVEHDPHALAREGSSPRRLLRELGAAGLDAAVIDDERWELRSVEETVAAAPRHAHLYCRRV